MPERCLRQYLGGFDIGAQHAGPAIVSAAKLFGKSHVGKSGRVDDGKPVVRAGCLREHRIDRRRIRGIAIDSRKAAKRPARKIRVRRNRLSKTTAGAEKQNQRAHHAWP